MTALEQFRPLIERALDQTHGHWGWDQLSEEVLSGRATLVPSLTGRSVVVVQPIRDLHFFTASGDLRELMVMEREFTEQARRQNFDRLTMIGRPGWERVLKPRGWKPEVSLVKDL